MGMLALMTGMRDQLRLRLGDARSEVVDITDDGRPKPSSGQAFYGISGGAVSQQAAESFDARYSLSVTITLKTGYAPPDRIGSESLLLQPAASPAAGNAASRDRGGVWARADEVGEWGHMNYAVMNAANAVLQAAGASFGFCEPLRYDGATYLGAKGGEWFDSDDLDNPPAGVAVKLAFSKARKVQPITPS